MRSPGRQSLRSEQAVESNRITEAKEIARRSLGPSELCMKIDLLGRSLPIGTENPVGAYTVIGTEIVERIDEELVAGRDCCDSSAKRAWVAHPFTRRPSDHTRGAAASAPGEGGT